MRPGRYVLSFQMPSCLNTSPLSPGRYSRRLNLGIASRNSPRPSTPASATTLRVSLATLPSTPLPRRHGLRIGPQSSPLHPSHDLQIPEGSVLGILPVPPCPPLAHKFAVEDPAVAKHHLPDRAAVRALTCRRCRSCRWRQWSGCGCRGSGCATLPRTPLVSPRSSWRRRGGRGLPGPNHRPGACPLAPAWRAGGAAPRARQQGIRVTIEGADPGT